MLENWKSIEGFEGIYEVSDLGNVKSLERMVSNGGGQRRVNERILKQGFNPKIKRGYLHVRLAKKGNQKNYDVHVLVSHAFLGPCPYKWVVNHINNDNWHDNRLVNLEYVTNRCNTSKDKKGGTSNYTGVSKKKGCKKFQASINIDNKEKYLGLFTSELKASEAYQTALKKHLESGGM